MKTTNLGLLALALCLGAPAACHAGSDSTDPHAPPSGCERTLCDLEHDGCQNPTTPDYCSQCFDECSAIVDTVPDCATECQSLCDDQTHSPQPDPCGDALTACRGSNDNTVCVDDLGSPAPDGTPCNDTASLVACRCGAEGDSACAQAIYAANPACQHCDTGWVATCQSVACPDERAAATACFTQSSCASTDCAECTSQTKAWNDCLNAAQEDPSDPGGCNSGSHGCWTQPHCNADGTSGP